MAFTIAIDGPAAAGKGTIGRALGRHFGLAHLDTGLLYRAAGRRTLDGLDPVEAARSLRAEDLDADDLRSPERGNPRGTTKPRNPRSFYIIEGRRNSVSYIQNV